MKKPQLYFLISLLIGLILRIIALIFLAPNVDVYGYFEGARGIIDLDYTSHRPPGYPIIIVPFLLLTNNGLLSAKLASLSTGIALIIVSYIIFRKAALKIYNGDSENHQEKAHYIGIFVSALISLNFLFIVNNGSALREDLISLCVILIFYYVIVKDEKNIKSYSILGFLIVFLTLTLLTAGIFLVVGIFIFYLLCKLKWFDYKNIPFEKVGILIFGSISSLVFWLLFSYFKFGDPFYNWHSHTTWFKQYTLVNFYSLEGLGLIALRAVTIGLVQILVSLTFYNGFFFIILIFYILKKNINKRQIFFIFIVVGFNFAYLSVFITTPRLIMYFFPIFFYLGVFPMIQIYINGAKRKEKHSEHSRSLGIMKETWLMIFYFITYSLRNFFLMFFFPVENKPIQLIIGVVIISIIFLIINEFICIYYFMKNKQIQYSEIE